ncbi:M1 family metallopeptidase [Gallaecimonas mangrovi]|uniref:M1 family metallopeptidase n=1 Tax=Gallaecimonas mangrovi TaxID=2291597 RepID=UPI000E20AAAF|nr:M1 family metallopeptidase [Gallaecimonas mangrovi]
MRIVLLGILMLGLFGCQDPSAETTAQGTAKAQAAVQEKVPVGQLPDWVTPLRYQLTLWVNPNDENFHGQGSIAIELTKASDHLWMHAKDMDQLTIQVATAKGDTLSTTIANKDPSGVILVKFPHTLQPQKLHLEMHYQAPFNKALEGLYKVNEQGRSYAFTQFEAIDARRAFPGFDEPRFKTPFDLTLAIPNGMKAVANTPEVKTEQKGDWTFIQFAKTKPLPTYLLAFAVGDLDIVKGPDIAKNGLRDHVIPLRGVAVHGKGEQLRFALENTGDLVSRLEQYFGIAYPYKKLDIIAVPDFAAGAMENPGAITFREQFLLLGDDAPFWQKRLFGAVTAHELAHQWFGDLVTLPWWTDTWLNESFATWAGAKIANQWRPGWGYDLDVERGAHRAMSADSLVNMREVRQPIHNNADVDNAFDSITYQKGAAVLKMFEDFVGPAAFQKGVHQYLTANAWGTGSASDFVNAIASAANNPAVSDAFMSFLTQTGVPKITVLSHCQNGHGSLSLSQSRYLPLGSKGDPHRTWLLPFCYSSDGNRHCEMLTGMNTAISLPACPTSLLPNADGAGYYRFSVEHWQPLISSLSSLTRAEALAVLDSFNAALADGSLSVSQYLAQVPMLASLKAGELATAPLGPLTFILEHQTKDKAALRNKMQLWYGARLKALGLQAKPEETKEDTQLRSTLATFLALTAKDKPLRQQLDQAAEAHLANAPMAISPDLLGLALKVWVQDAGQPAFDRLKERLGDSQDAIERQAVLNALASVEQPKLAAQSRDLILAPALRVNERMMLLSGQAAGQASRDATYAWFKEHLPELEVLWPEASRQRFVKLFSGFCTEQKAQDVDAFFTKLNFQGAERNLKGTVERIQLCSARANQ